MKWFWYSLIVFCLLMCSCKSKKVATDINVVSKNHSELSHYHETATIDTTRLLYIEDLKQIITIEEDVIVTEYDKESGKPIKKTETKRKATQDSNKAVAKEEVKGESVVKNDSTHHVADVSKKIDSKTEEESIGGQESFGKWLGIIIGTAIVVGCIALFIYLRRKSKISKSLL